MKALYVAGFMTAASSTSAFSAGCNTNLNSPQQGVEDLNKILNCLESQITDLETRLSGMTATSHQSSSSDINTGSVKSLLENAYVNVTANGASRTGDILKVSFNVTNKTSKDLYIAFDVSNMTVTDNLGNSGQLSNASLPRFRRSEKNKSYYTVLSPGASTPVFVSFNGSQIKGGQVTFGTPIMNLLNDEVLVYSILWRVNLPPQ